MELIATISLKNIDSPIIFNNVKKHEGKMINNKNDKKDNTKTYKDLGLFAEIESLSEQRDGDPAARKALNSVQRREMISLGLAFIFGGSSFVTAKVEDKKAVEIYNKKIDEQGGFKEINKSCSEFGVSAQQQEICVDKKRKLARKASNDAKAPYQWVSLAFSSAAIASFGSFFVFFGKSQKLQEKLTNDYFSKIDDTYEKTRTIALDALNKNSPKGPLQ